ncbi:DUF5677 domain-containing protein [Streptomyces sp900129855]|uniref:DUF5677 domain-containing protein n=1 Tax=Streptomyces sp. 900129855 TaxID=3155129 RepID=A0ABV2ZGK1_9ACTN
MGNKECDAQWGEELAQHADVLAGVVRELISHLEKVPFAQVLAYPKAALFRACLLRQAEATESASLLAKNGLGHMAVVYVRPACEEFFWLKYLLTLSDPHIASLFINLSSLEAVRALTAQQQFTGKKGMKSLGFPAAFVNLMTSKAPAGRAAIAAVGRDLNWPEPTDPKGSQIPTTHWVANAIGEGKLYDFLFSATSRAVHFSMHEAARKIWVDDDGDMDLEASIHVRYRTHFGIYWTCDLLARTLLLMMQAELKTEGDTTGAIEVSDDFFERLRSAIAGVRKTGSPPIVIPEEFNLRRKPPAAKPTPTKG